MKENTVWKLRTTDHIGSLPRPSENVCMWVEASCLAGPTEGAAGGGLNFQLNWCEDDGWVIENWVEPLDALPEFSDDIYEALFTSFYGELQVKRTNGKFEPFEVEYERNVLGKLVQWVRNVCSIFTGRKK